MRLSTKNLTAINCACSRRLCWPGLILFGVWMALPSAALAQRPRYPLEYPPKLPGEQQVVTDRSPRFLEPGPNLRQGVEIAREPPLVDFQYYPNQSYPGNPWCFRGVGAVVDGKYYSALCDHLAPLGTAYLFEYNPETKKFRLLVNTAEFLRKSGEITPEMNYTPGEIQTRIDPGRDGWLYYGTTRGSTRVTNDAHGFRGEWVLRTHPKSGKTEVVSAFPVAKHCILGSVLDPQRMIFYGGTASGDFREKDVQFFALDVTTGKVLKQADNGFDRYCIFAKSTGCVYWDGQKYDPATNEITPSEAPHVRSATAESAEGVVYGTSRYEADLWAFDTRAEKLTQLGSGAVGTQGYVAAIHLDPAGRYLYYIPGAHGGASKDGTPVVQYDLKRKKAKVLAFLHRYYQEKYGYNLDGCFCSVLDPAGDKFYISWDGWREGQPRGWESSALTVLHIPPGERQP